MSVPPTRTHARTTPQPESGSEGAHVAQEGKKRKRKVSLSPTRPRTLKSTTSVLTATALVYAVGAGITAAAGTRLAFQLILIAVFGYSIHRKLHLAKWRVALLLFVAVSPTRSVGIGQFARLLPTLVVVAVFQAPSPESNPYSPLPVTAIVARFATVDS